ncbi:adenylosuccinate synthetase [Catellatospora methionotrophica]|uniref:Adenylosuccinate synthetase n=1 Tax=Catellatospora methionotrophica TaxID=121620 RepID=A0A8J3LIE8_9ACTN|nr:adenylosuccinate synthetase [Catellatospora methionotrophica]GIG15070.1 adenylosuccinate synthetase [Catellatospora methionotrophica]
MNQPRHVIVVDLGYGDAGKGTIVDWLCATRPVDTVIRFNGGAQAAHNVVTPGGRHHTFAQFGSGTLHGVRTHLSRFMMVDPLALAAEAEHLVELGVSAPFDLLTVDRRALLTTPWHRAANRRREAARGDDRHGSCGMGVGETAAFALAHPDLAVRAGDTTSPSILARKLGAVRDALTAELGPLDAPPVAAVAEAFRWFGSAAGLVDSSRQALTGPCVFEGAQGVLLDEWRGWHPYTTWSTTTFDNAETLLAEDGDGDALRLGVVRTYTTRHGAGPLVTEDEQLTAALPERHNGHGPWQGAWRAGHFDAVAHRYAVEVCGGVDALAVTHADAAAHHELRMCLSYDQLDRIVPGERGDLAYQEKLTQTLTTAVPVYTGFGEVGDVLGVPVEVTSYGPTWADKVTR